MEADAPAYLWSLIPVLFIVFFSAVWLGVTSLLGATSGWFRLQNAFPDRPDLPLAKLRGVNGMLGVVSYRYCLRLDVCSSGLRVGVIRLLGPFARPFFVPWANITVERGDLLFAAFYKLNFGMPVIGALRLYAGTAEKLAATGRLQLPDRQSTTPVPR
jgi:hypothetical protein